MTEQFILKNVGISYDLVRYVRYFYNWARTFEIFRSQFSVGLPLMDDTEYIIFGSVIILGLGTATDLVNYPGSSLRNQSMAFSISPVMRRS